MTDTDEVQTPWYVWHGNGDALPQTHPVNDDIYCRKCWAGLTIPDLPVYSVITTYTDEPAFGYTAQSGLVWSLPPQRKRPPMADPLVAIRFADLADWWHADTDAMSMDRERYEHTAYKRILEMGSAVLRYMLADLRDRQGHWFDALVELSGDASVAAHAKGSMRTAREAWLAWGKAKRLI